MLDHGLAVVVVIVVVVAAAAAAAAEIVVPVPKNAFLYQLQLQIAAYNREDYQYVVVYTLHSEHHTEKVEVLVVDNPFHHAWNFQTEGVATEAEIVRAEVGIHGMLVRNTEAIHVVQKLAIDVVGVVVGPTFVVAEDNDMILDCLHRHSPFRLDDDAVVVVAAAVIYEVAFLWPKTEIRRDVEMVEVMLGTVEIGVVDFGRFVNEVVDSSAVRS